MNIISYNKKPKRNKEKISYPENEDLIKIFRNNMFTYNPPDELDKMQVENALSSGIACLYICPDERSVNYNKWCCTPAYPADVVTNNNTFKRCTTFGSDYGLELEVDKDCILLYNNSNKSPDYVIDKYSHLIGEIDKTIYTIVKWSRLIPIPKVTDDNDITKYKLAMESVLEGKLVNVISDISGLISNNDNKDNMLQLTDTSASEKLHFLSEFRQEVIKRICCLYGIPMNLSAKNAQVISDELHGMDMYSLYVLVDRYYARKESFERASKFTGHNWEFDFSELTKHTINDILNHGSENETEEEYSEKESVKNETV